MVYSLNSRFKYDSVMMKLTSEISKRPFKEAKSKIVNECAQQERIDEIIVIYLLFYIEKRRDDDKEW